MLRNIALILLVVLAGVGIWFATLSFTSRGPVDDPYQHVLVVTGYRVGTDCSGDACPIDSAHPDVWVQWRLETPALADGDAPALDGVVCQQNTWGKTNQSGASVAACSGRFPIAPGTFSSEAPPGRETPMRVEVSPPSAPPGTAGVIKIELLVGARRTPVQSSPDMTVEAKAECFVPENATSPAACP